jgi:hypothetical protein
MQYTENLILKLPEITDETKIRTDLNYNWAILDEVIQALRIFRMTIVDIKAADTDGIHAAIAGTGGAQEITTAITNPDESRNITITCSNLAGSSGIVTITGLVRGVSDTEGLTISLGATVKGNKAFDTVPKINIPSTLNVGDNLQVGFGDKVGLTHEISATSKVYKVVINAVDVTSTYVPSKVNATYGTIDFSDISAYQDIKVFYLGN